VVGSSEWLWIIIVALILLGGPRLMRELGHLIGESRKITRNLEPSERQIKSDMTKLKRQAVEEIEHNFSQSSHLFFLTTFLKPRTVDDLPIMSSIEWNQLLGEHPSELTKKLEERGLVVRSNLAIHLDYKFNVDELRDLLKAHELPQSGLKEDLIFRLLQNHYKDMREAVAGLRLLQCTEWGAQIVAQYLDDTSKQDEKTIAQKLKIPASKVREWIEWIIVAAVGGIIGNRADDALLRLTRLIVGHSTPHTPQTTITTPTITPVPRASSVDASPAGTAGLDDSVSTIGTPDPSNPGYSYISEYPPSDISDYFPMIWDFRIRPVGPVPQIFAVVGKAVEPPYLMLKHYIDPRVPNFSIVLNHVEQKHAVLKTSFTIANLGAVPLAFSLADFSASSEYNKAILGPHTCDGVAINPHFFMKTLAVGVQKDFDICWSPFGLPQIILMFRISQMAQHEFVVWYLRKNTVGHVP
jgi:Sec-independent protein translocase protein TatA